MEIPAELKAKLEEALATLKEMLSLHATEAIAELRKVSEEAARAGVEVVEGMSAAGLQLAEGKIDQLSAEIALRNYEQALILIGNRVTNVAQVQAYKRAMRILDTVKSVGLGILTMALNLAVPAAGTFLDGLASKIGGASHGPR